MQNEKARIQEVFRTNKVKIIERAYFFFFVVNIIDSIVSRYHTAYNVEHESSILFGTLILFTVLMGILLISKFFIRKSKVKTCIYSLLGIAYTVCMHYFFRDKAFVTLHGIVLVLYVIPSIMNKLKYMLCFSIVPIAINIYYFVNPPNHAIKVGSAFYFNTLLTFIMLTYLLYEVVKQNTWYEDQLEERVDTSEAQNIELAALNEEYIATEDELFNKYDELTKLNTELEVTSKKLTKILNVTHEAFIEINTKSLETRFNRTAKEMFRFPDDEDVDLKSVINQFPELECKKLKKAYRDIKDNIVSQNEIEVSYIYDKSTSYYNFVMTKFIEKETEYVLVAVEDITLEKEEEQSLYKAAYVDILTGLMSKQALYKKMDMRLEQNKDNFAMYILDLKGMKDINAMFGFKIGDEVIKSVGLNLEELFEEECLVARTGGDEFALIIDGDISPRTINALISKKLERYINGDMNVRINYKLGVAYMKDAKDSMELYQNAEMAMYMAKENILEDVTVYSANYRIEAEKSIRLSQELENALLNKEIYLDFQPKISSETKKIVGYEALVRWNSSELGFVSPLDFIRIAERTGYIIVLGRFIIEESCRFAKKAIEKNSDIIVSINISSVQLKKYNFENELLKIIDSHEVPRRNIGIEITETAIILDLERTQKILRNIKKSGITIFLDDFGTGYSSLSYLNILPIDVLKIDKSFIDAIEADSKQKNLVKYIIRLAKSMGLRIVAEGVEVEGQFDILKEYECEMIQGYYFYKPLSQEEALSLL